MSPANPTSSSNNPYRVDRYMCVHCGQHAVVSASEYSAHMSSCRDNPRNYVPYECLKLLHKMNRVKPGRRVALFVAGHGRTY
ncbi:hypothetical protein H4R19_003811 [Coemansia spiralis]|nr:hypothetical protein H4R19_003811 [Coemansia spiralis]